MKNGCKDFVSPTMDKIKIEPYFENRLHDIMFAQTFLRMANNRGKCIEDSMTLIQELEEYIVYLYSHTEQLEKDKKYLLEQRLKRNRRLKEEIDALRWAETNLVDKIASFFEKEENWSALKHCWLENDRSDDLRKLLKKALKGQV